MVDRANTRDDEVSKLQARIKELEGKLDKQDDDDDRPTRGRYAGSFMDARYSKVDTATRVVRGMTMASVEFVRLFVDAVSSFGNDAIRRNESRRGEGRTVRD